MQAFLNDAAVRDMFIGRVKAHALADEIVQGTYWENGKGCAVGCTLHSSQHAEYETQLGIPRELAHLQDALFEALPDAEAKKFPLQFLEAIPLGADLSRVWDGFHLSLLLDAKDGLIAIPDIKPEVAGWIREIAVLYERSSVGGTPSDAEKDRAAWAASAARATWDAWATWTTWTTRGARDARAARAARAAWDAWGARAARATWDAWGAWTTWDAWDARDARIMHQRDVLLKLLRDAPVPQ